MTLNSLLMYFGVVLTFAGAVFLVLAMRRPRSRSPAGIIRLGALPPAPHAETHGVNERRKAYGVVK